MNRKLLPPTLLALLSALPLIQTARAQETVPLEEARDAARKLSEYAILPANAPLAVEVNLEQPRAIKGGESGVMVLPDKRFALESLAVTGKTVTPVGLLWSLKATPEVQGKRISQEKLRLVSVGKGEERRTLQLFLLGVAGNAEGQPELLLFGKESEPLFRVALQKSSNGKQEFPIEISARKHDEESAILTLQLLGGYKGDLKMIQAAE